MREENRGGAILQTGFWVCLSVLDPPLSRSLQLVRLYEGTVSYHKRCPRAQPSVSLISSPNNSNLRFTLRRWCCAGFVIRILATGSDTRGISEYLWMHWEASSGSVLGARFNYIVDHMSKTRELSGRLTCPTA